ncbi:MAG: DUF2460 domain-containing protein [Magnetococcales bacterium]|nr:DUF2460 domain-containing protein [Magnetococcales bacterium]MBF0115842.1 DUF2460 domain-containing protein [Magnetococcales bacterium]
MAETGIVIPFARKTAFGNPYVEPIDGAFVVPFRQKTFVINRVWESGTTDDSQYTADERPLAIFPSLPGMSWELKKTPEFRTSIQTAVSGREQRGAFRAYPVWRFTLLFDWLRAGNLPHDYEELQGFFLMHRGSFTSFLFLDPTDSLCVDMPFGKGNDIQAQFQLTRSFGFNTSFTFAEPVENLKSVTAIKLDGQLLSAPGDYTVSGTGLVSFTVPPTSKSIITWSGIFYYRCRFAEDTADFARTLPNLWELRELAFIGAPGNRI